MLKNRAAVSKHCFAVLVSVAKLYLALQAHERTTDYSPLGSFVHGIYQVRKLEWVAIPFSRESSQLRDQTCVFFFSRQILYH